VNKQTARESTGGKARKEVAMDLVQKLKGKAQGRNSSFMSSFYFWFV